MLFKVHATKDTFTLNEELKAIPEFERLTERQMTFVILSTDYTSPFRKLTQEDRKTQAAKIAGYKMEPDGKRLDTNGRNLINGKVGAVEAAIKVYRDLQKDEDYETLLSLNKLISQIREFNNKPDKTALELEKAVNMNVQKLDKLLETKRKIEELIDVRDDEPAKLTKEELTPMSVDEQNLPILQQLNAGLI
jgi:hypothetical protein